MAQSQCQGDSSLPDTNKEDETLTVHTDIQQISSKKGPGRPVGSKGKKKLSAVDLDDDVDDNGEQILCFTI
jgi:hypothetical protein